MIDPNWRPPVLASARLWLRPFREHDADALFEYARNPNVIRYTTWEAHRTRDDSVAFIRDFAASSYLEQVPDPLAIAPKPDGADVDPFDVPPIGAVGCRWASKKDRCMEFGYWIGEAYWGRGLATEAARALLDFVFAHYDVERVQAHCFAENRASARVLAKLGLTFEGTCRSGLFHRDRFWDLHLFSVLRGEWRGQPGADAR